MTNCRETLKVKSILKSQSCVKREAYLAKRLLFRSLDASRFTLHEQHGQGQAGR
jgi:hypothetical protein